MGQTTGANPYGAMIGNVLQNYFQSTGHPIGAATRSNAATPDSSARSVAPAMANAINFPWLYGRPQGAPSVPAVAQAPSAAAPAPAATPSAAAQPAAPSAPGTPGGGGGEGTTSAGAGASGGTGADGGAGTTGTFGGGVGSIGGPGPASGGIGSAALGGALSGGNLAGQAINAATGGLPSMSTPFGNISLANIIGSLAGTFAGPLGVAVNALGGSVLGAARGGFGQASTNAQNNLAIFGNLNSPVNAVGESPPSVSSLGNFGTPGVSSNAQVASNIAMAVQQGMITPQQGDLAMSNLQSFAPTSTNFFSGASPNVGPYSGQGAVPSTFSGRATGAGTGNPTPNSTDFGSDAPYHFPDLPDTSPPAGNTGTTSGSSSVGVGAAPGTPGGIGGIGGGGPGAGGEGGGGGPAGSGPGGTGDGGASGVGGDGGVGSGPGDRHGGVVGGERHRAALRARGLRPHEISGLVSAGQPQSRRDDVPVRLQHGEFVMPRAAVQQYGPLLDMIRRAALRHAHSGARR